MGLIKNIIDTSKNNRQTRRNLDTLTIQKAQKNFTAKTGKPMSPSRLKSEMDSMFPSPEAKAYLKDKIAIRKEYKNKYGL